MTSAVVPAEAAEAPVALEAPSFARCTLMVTFVVIFLRMLGFRRTLVVLKRLARPSVECRVPGHGLLDTTVRRVATVGAYFPGRVLCLEQAIALHFLLQWRGVPTRFRIGVQPYRFAAHAWVEYLGNPIGENVDAMQKFVPMPDIEVS